MTAKFTQLY